MLHLRVSGRTCDHFSLFDLHCLLDIFPYTDSSSSDGSSTGANADADVPMRSSPPAVPVTLAHQSLIPIIRTTTSQIPLASSSQLSSVRSARAIESGHLESAAIDAAVETSEIKRFIKSLLQRPASANGICYFCLVYRSEQRFTHSHLRCEFRQLDPFGQAI
jgi:hypothetical protein